MKCFIKGILLSALLLTFSCKDIDDLQDRMDAVESEISDLKDEVAALKNAYDDGKIITNVASYSEPKPGGYVITFSDGSSIDILNGADGVNGANGANGADGVDGADGADGTDGADGVDGETPVFVVDQEGYWCVQYGDDSPIRIKNTSGEDVKATGDKGASISVIVTEDNYYAYVSQNAETEDDILFITPYTSDSAKVVSYVVENQQTHCVTIAMMNGDTYTFAKAYATPTGIALLTTSQVFLTEKSTAYVEFRVNPSTACFNYDVSSDSCEIELDLVSTNKSATSYVTTPTNFQLDSVAQVFNDQGVAKKGQYRAYISDLGVAKDYSDNVALVLSIEDETAGLVQYSSSAFKIVYSGCAITEFSFLTTSNSGVVVLDAEAEITDNEISIVSPAIFDVTNLVATFETNGEYVLVDGKEQINGFTSNDFSSPVTYTIVSPDGDQREFTVTVEMSNLPVVVIDTENETPITSKEDWLTNTSITIYNADGTVDYTGESDNIRGRGNSTWSFPKKPYALKLDKKAKILDMPKHKRWVLLANWKDRTLIRNTISFEMANRTSLAWTPRGQHVELILNGEHKGNYFLCEQIKIDENRVNIAELENTDTDEDVISGGYLMELDVNYDEVNKFKTTTYSMPYMFKEPDEDVLNDAQFAYMEAYVNELEQLLADDTEFAEHSYQDLLDIESCVDWWLVNEVAESRDINWPKSVYMYKDRGEKMFMGPVWDFDWGTYSTEYMTSDFVSKAVYLSRLLEDETFVDLAKERWEVLKPQFEDLTNYVDEMAESNKVSDKLNIAMWPISSTTNSDETLSYDEAIAQMKSVIQTRIATLEGLISGL